MPQIVSFDVTIFTRRGMVRLYYFEHLKKRQRSTKTVNELMERKKKHEMLGVRRTIGEISWAPSSAVCRSAAPMAETKN